jgi:hypothetical protein
MYSFVPGRSSIAEPFLAVKYRQRFRKYGLIGSYYLENPAAIEGGGAIMLDPYSLSSSDS